MLSALYMSRFPGCESILLLNRLGRLKKERIDNTQYAPKGAFLVWGYSSTYLEIKTAPIFPVNELIFKSVLSFPNHITFLQKVVDPAWGEKKSVAKIFEKS